MVIYQSGYKCKYYMENIFNDNWVEITEDDFNCDVIRVREMYDMKYIGDDRLFIDKNTGFKYLIKRFD